MPVHQEISVSQIASVPKSNLVFRLQSLLCRAICVGVIASGWASAQETPKPSPAPGTRAPADQKPPAPSKPVAMYDSLQSKSVFFPDIASSTGPLSPGQKFELFVDNSISLHTITFSMLAAAVSQADNSPTGYGQGWDAYAKRFGSSMGREASAEFFGTFMLASALREDPRFYPEDHPTFGHAVKYSVQRVFVTRNDDGHDVMNVQGLLGPAMAEGLANVYWPDRNRTVGDTLLRYGLDLATKAGGNMLREYWPVFYAKIHHAH